MSNLNTKDDSDIPRIAFVILIFQVIAWCFILSPYFEDLNASNDAAGTGMQGLGLILVGLPCMVFIFFTTLYFFKKSLPIWAKFIYTINYIGLLIVITQVNW